MLKMKSSSINDSKTTEEHMLNTAIRKNTT